MVRKSLLLPVRRRAVLAVVATPCAELSMLRQHTDLTGQRHTLIESMSAITEEVDAATCRR
jgi:hypothetical protein